MAGICEGRVVIVTGAGRGIGRGHALEFARQGAKVVVNDIGGSVDGSGKASGPAQEVCEEIHAMGGEAVPNHDDVSDWDGAKNMISQAVDTFGGLDVLVNNAGILRDRMLVNMTEAEWDAVIKVHLKGTFCPTRHAAEYWRERSKEGKENDARIISTSSTSGLIGNVGQANYGAAKSGIASFTRIVARELLRYGVTANAISPGARTRMTENLPGNVPAPTDGSFDPRDPENVAPIVVWLGSKESKNVTGQIFQSSGGAIGIWQNWTMVKRATSDTRFDPAELGPVVEDLLAALPPEEPRQRPQPQAQAQAQPS